MVFKTDIHWHYEYANRLGKAAGRRRIQMQFAEGPLQMRCAPATLQFHLTPERMAQPECTSNLLPPPPSEGEERVVCSDVAIFPE